MDMFPHGGIPLITLFLGMIHSLSVQGFQEYRFFNVWAKFLVKRLNRKPFIKVQNWALIRLDAVHV